MKIRRVKTENFRLHADTDVTFDDGLVGLLGGNESGKSTLLEAVIWALFGGDALRGTKAGIRWHGAPVRRVASVELWFEVNESHFKIYRDETNADLYELDATGVHTTTVLAEGTNPVNQYVPGLLGMNLSEFSSSFLVGQKDVSRIPAMKPVERTTFIRNVMGVGKLDQAVTACRARKNELGHRRDGMAAGLGERGPLEERVATTVAAAIAAADVADICHEAHRAAVDDQVNASTRAQAMEALAVQHHSERLALDGALGDRDRAREQMASLDRDLATAHEAGKAIDAASEELSGLDGLLGQRDSLRDARVAKGEVDSVVEGLAAIEDDRERLGERVDQSNRVVTAFEDAGGVDAWKEAGTMVTDAQAIHGELNLKRTQALQGALLKKAQALDAVQTWKRKRDAITESGRRGTCPTCLRQLGRAYEDVVTSIQVDLDSAVADSISWADESVVLGSPDDDETEALGVVGEAETHLAKMEEMREASATATTDLAALAEALFVADRTFTSLTARKEQLPAVSFDEERLREVESEARRLEVMDSSLADARVSFGNLVRYEADRAIASVEEVEAIQRAEAARQAAEALGYDPERHQEASRALGTADTALSNALVSKAHADAGLVGADERATTAEKDVGAYDERAVELEEVTADHLVHETAASRLVEFRASVAGTIRPELEELMTGFIQVLTDGRHEAVSLSDDFQPTLYEDGVAVEVVSGGCEDVAALAMRLAISQMITERAGHPLSLLILDEPFGSLDENRRANVLALIRQLSGVFEQVIVISHIPETRDAVDQVVSFEFDEGAGRTRVAA